MSADADRIAALESELGQWQQRSTLAVKMQREAEAERDAAQAEAAAMRADLEETLPYAPEYFREKWSLGESLNGTAGRAVIQRSLALQRVVDDSAVVLSNEFRRRVEAEKAHAATKAQLGRAVAALKGARIWLGYIDAPESRAEADLVLDDPTCIEAGEERAEYVALYKAAKELVRYWDEDVAVGDVEGDIQSALEAIDARLARARQQ